MHLGWKRPLCGVVLAFSLFSAAVASADKSAARSLAVEGKKAFDAGDYSAAAQYFEKAERQFHASTHLLMLALARIELGQLVEAQEHLYSVVNEALPPDANDVQKKNQEQARQLIAGLEQRIGAIVLTIEPSDAAGLTIEIDGSALSSDLLGAPRRTNPGERKVVVSADGFETVQQTVTVAEGASESLHVKLAPRTAGAPGPESTPEDQGAGPRYRPLAYTALGVGVVGVTAGTVLLVMGLSDSKKADGTLEDECNTAPSSPRCTPDSAATIEDLDQDAATKKTGAVIAFSVGGAALATGVVLWVLGKPSQEVSLGKGVFVAPALTPTRGGAHLGLEGRF